MTIISNLVVFASLTGILSFGMWELDMEEVPILYQFGTFLASYWFHDKLKPGKPHYGNFASSGPPLVAVTGSGAARPWPYSDSTGVNIGGITFEENDTEKTEKTDRANISKYTPVNGLYGVTNVRENSRDKTVEYYPAAIEPNDYIAKRLLGDHADWSDLVGLGPGGDPHLWNEQLFKEGSPFGAAEIGAGQIDSEKWKLFSRYASSDTARKLLVPLTSTGNGVGITNPYTQFWESQRDYSGGEYPETDSSYNSTYAGHEKAFVSDFSGSSQLVIRPDWYQQDAFGNELSGQNQRDIAAWAGEGGTNTNTNPIIKSNTLLYTAPTFYDPSSISTTNQSYYNWGIPEPTLPSGKTWINGKGPKDQQIDYITTQLNNGSLGPYTKIANPPLQDKTDLSKKKSRRTYSR